MQGIKSKCFPTELSIVTKQWYQTQTSCNTSCPVNQYIFQQACLQDCPPFTSKNDNGFIKYCKYPAINELECPSEFCNPKYPFCFKENCLSSCPEYTVSHNGSCLMDCPKESPYLTATCDGVCYTGAKFCSKTCPSSHPYIFSSLKLRHCLVECPDYTVLDKRFCRLSCPVDHPFLFGKTCLEKCPDTHPMIVFQTSPFNQIFTCRTECPKDNASFRNVCVSICPKGTFLDNGVQCVDKCGDIRPFMTTIPSKRKSIYFQQCVSRCPLGKYSINRNATFECVSKCPSNFSLYNNSCVPKCPLTHPMKKKTNINILKTTICVKSCPKDMFTHEKECIFQCPTPLVHYMSKCLPECQKPLPIILKVNRTCFAACPVGFVKYNNTCIDKCPKHVQFIENGTCVDHCASKNSLSIVTNIGKTCIYSATCTNETMLIKGTTTCTLVCPRKTHAIIKDVCTNNIGECHENYVLQDTNRGLHCQEKCSDAFYKNGKMCVTQCPVNKFIMDRNCSDACFGTRPLKYKENRKKGKTTCVSECPDGYLMHEKECLTSDWCMRNDLMYTFKNTCYSQCPEGTSQNDFTCIAHDTSNVWRGFSFFLFIAGQFFIIFFMLCCFKGCICTRLRSWWLNRKLEKYQVY